MSIIRNQLNIINNVSIFRNFAGISIQTRNHTERKPNLRKPKEPDFKKKVLLKLIEPYYAKDKRSDSEKCSEWKLSKPYIPHPYVRMLAEDCTKELKSKFIYLFHINSISDHNFNELRKKFLKKNIFLKNYSYEVIKLSIKDTKFANLSEFFRYYGCFACSEDEKLYDVQKLCKESGFVTLLAGIFENRILNLKQLEEYKNLGGLDNVRSQLCNLLSMQTAQLSSNLSYHSQELSFNLNNYSNKDKNEVESKKDD